MYPPIFEIVSADLDVQAQIGTRFYPFGEAPQGVTKPYGVFQVTSGFPENYINERPDIDTYSIQVDVYATTASSARDSAEALRDAIEPHAHIVAWRGEDRDPDTRNYRVSFDVDWFVDREVTT